MTPYPFCLSSKLLSPSPPTPVFFLSCIPALGEIGVCDSELTAQLLWVVRFEKLAEVRAEACHTIAALGLKDEQVVKTLKDLCTVEEDPFVLR